MSTSYAGNEYPHSMKGLLGQALVCVAL